MVRGKVQLKWIENKINRQVTFSKRRSGLLKKAHEISVLCDVEVALIVFSTNGKLYEYSTDSGMDRILERYERYSYADRKLVPTDPGSQANWSLECTKLKAKVDKLQKYQRHLVGENIENLCIKELQNLEQQIDSSLKQIRSRKNQLMHESISDLEKKERSLHEQNNKLGKKLKEREKELPHQVPWEQPSPSQNPQTFLLTHSLPTLNLGGNYRVRNKLVEDEGPPQPRPTTLMPPWTLTGVDDKGPPQPHPTISMPPWMLTGVEDKMPPQPRPTILMPPWMLT